MNNKAIPSLAASVVMIDPSGRSAAAAHAVIPD